MSLGDLQSVSLSCSFLQDVTRPLLFRSLTFRPPGEKDRNIPSSAQEDTPFSERLTFLTSDAVARWVREVRIIWVRPESRNLEEHQRAYESLGAKLPCFERVAKFHAERFAFKSMHLHALAECPYLKHVNLVNCPIDFALHPPSLATQCGVVELTFQDGASFNGNWWSSFISPMTTRAITATNYQPSIQLVDILASKSVMTQLKQLTLCCTSPGSPHFVEALSHCPFLESLRFVGEDYYIPTIPHGTILQSDIVPYLKTVRAGVECFPSYFDGRPIANIEVTGDVEGDSSAVQFISDLHDCYPKLASLSLNLSHVSTDVLLLPLSKLPHLEELRIGDRRLSKDRVKEVREFVPY